MSATDEFFERYRAAWNANDGDALTACFTDDCVYTDAALGKVCKGHGQLRDFLAETFQAFPDFRIESTTVVTGTDGDYALEWTMSGTQKGNMPNLPATGKSFSIRGATIIELEHGKIRRCSDYWDLAAFIKQLGHNPG